MVLPRKSVVSKKKTSTCCIAGSPLTLTKKETIMDYFKEIRFIIPAIPALYYCSRKSLYQPKPAFSKSVFNSGTSLYSHVQSLWHEHHHTYVHIESTDKSFVSMQSSPFLSISPHHGDEAYTDTLCSLYSGSSHYAVLKAGPECSFKGKNRAGVHIPALPLCTLLSPRLWHL